MVSKVYIIDDDDISIYLTSLVLEQAGFAREICTYTSADDALADLGLPVSAPLPDVILIDLNMPVKSGWDFLDILRPYEGALQGKLDVFILTSSIATSDKDQSRDYPLVRGFLHKPFNEESLDYIKRSRKGRS
ncbi:response regulator [Pontibacter virosus]|uniref:Response regulator receiver domain-containing protein n=1 Tax=Pontibacter virosus TaxID=1765052 RepID=A0A2U1B0D3_9BACT|nr:response regulator [Pontibacter virosus]PVY42149.1 response regulator receiver domain-containing protein [Pontibacter virosus]